MPRFNVNMDEAVIFAAKLDKMGKTALPYAIRTALNSAAFNVKKETMPKEAKSTFTNRNPNFFKANSRVEMASGNNIRQMKSIVGFIEGGLKGGNNFAVKDLEKQEHGGEIKKKSFIPTDAARSGGSNKKQVKAQNRLSAINKIVNSRLSTGKTEKARFFSSVKHAGVGGYVLSEYKEQTILWRVNSLKRGKDGKLKLSAVYSFKDKRSVHVDSTKFMQTASLKSNRHMATYFIAAAQKVIIPN